MTNKANNWSDKVCQTCYLLKPDTLSVHRTENNGMGFGWYTEKASVHSRVSQSLTHFKIQNSSVEDR